ncbi:hypothetical protein SAMN05421504_102590 [Amycolatopsis xylanica]|uniref:CHRD domain-containing protein n=1 Tax=Amycolatopsis xylanica TaxID=589385 RepID=A0A1H2ZMN7_9PSEU|nr:hypothetical protein [Amycolatopsis xylanica]SDX18636.1 hypothetical protein SAMN05421504_102590 [Amycolatopsis xylanica]
MQSNTRLTRRILMAAGAVVACGAIAVTGVLSANAADQPAGVTGTAATDGGTGQKVFTGEQAATPQAPENKPVGDVISTGIKDAKGEIVFYAVAVNEPSLPNTHFGIMQGHRTADGKVTADIVTNEFSGSDKAPGFHGVTVGNNTGGGNPAFGYYAGPAAKIIAKGAQAHTAKWSEDSDIVVFWFDKVTEPSGLKAFDAAGKQLPAGNTQPGRG